MMKLVSIIIPVYNCENYISKCLDSIVNQTYKNLEIILVNDGSTDKSIDIINNYASKDNRIKIIDKKNEGVSIARNIGMKASTGEYIAFADSDDWFELDAIEKLCYTIEKENVDVVRGNYFINKSLNENGKISNLYELSNKKYLKSDIKGTKMIEHFLLVDQPIANLVMLLLIKSNVIKKNKIEFDSNLYMMEDVVFYLNILLNVNSIYYLDYPIYHYYINNDSATKSVKKYEKNIVGILQVNKVIRKILFKNKIFSTNNISKLNSNHLKMITNYFYFLTRDKVQNNKKIIRNYINSAEFQDLMRDINLDGIPIKNKIMIFLIKNGKINFLFIFNNIVRLVAKVLKK